MNPSIQPFLTGLVDYAGLFPPAALDMPTAIRNYAEQCRSEHRRWLGRFVLPACRLWEFENVAYESEIELDRVGKVWKLSALIGPDVESDLRGINSFNYRQAKNRGTVFTVDTVEIKVERPDQIWFFKENARTFTVYFEIPVQNAPRELLPSIREAHGRAKVRTGGTTPDAIPSCLALARFLGDCAMAQLPFKATAGLHHPIRSINKLTYDPDSEKAKMHGFINVFLGAAFAYYGMDLEQVVALLEDESTESFHFGSDGAGWRTHQLTIFQIENVRNNFAIGFGSCSVREPVEGLKSIGLL